MSFTINGRSLIQAVTFRVPTTGEVRRRSYTHTSHGVTFLLVPAGATGWMLCTPDGQASYDDLEAAVMGIDAYEGEGATQE